jgi:hypothetical protein
MPELTSIVAWHAKKCAVGAATEKRKSSGGGKADGSAR